MTVYMKEVSRLFTEKYSSTPIFPYAASYCMVLPKGLEKCREIGEGCLVTQKDYLIYFKPNTPDKIKQRFIKDYAEYHKRKTAEYGIFE